MCLADHVGQARWSPGPSEVTFRTRSRRLSERIRPPGCRAHGLRHGAEKGQHELGNPGSVLPREIDPRCDSDDPEHKNPDPPPTSVVILGGPHSEQDKVSRETPTVTAGQLGSWWGMRYQLARRVSPRCRCTGSSRWCRKRQQPDWLSGRLNRLLGQSRAAFGHGSEELEQAASRCHVGRGPTSHLHRLLAVSMAADLPMLREWQAWSADWAGHASDSSSSSPGRIERAPRGTRPPPVMANGSRIPSKSTPVLVGGGR